MTVSIRPSIPSKIGFASHQNSVPVLRELEIWNEGEQDFDDLELELSADPPFLEPRKWRIDRLQAGGTLHITERDLKLNAGFLAELSESLLGEVRLVLKDGDAEIAHAACPVEILARNQWGGWDSMPELLPAFCMPNDPAVDRILKAASDVLRRAGKPCGIDGYTGGSRSRSWELASAIWSAVAGFGLSYALPPASFERCGQKVRIPGAILESGVATCLDLTLLFASALEQAGLNPLLIITKGHAFIGVWLQPQEFAQLITEEAVDVRKRVELQEMVLFETTLATQSPVPAFSVAVDRAKRQLTDEEFLMAVDVRRARMQRIRPLSSSAAPSASQDEGPAPQVSESLEEAPPLPSFDIEIEHDPAGPRDRVSLWQRKLLDLTTRNRLLHLPERSKSVPLLCPDPARLEDLLASGKTIRIRPIPILEAGGRDSALYAQQHHTELEEELASEALAKSEVLSPLEKPKLESELVDLYRKARTDLNEGGANTLFLAAGFLNWKKSPEDSRIYRAPLILIPVKLKRRSAISDVSMTAHEDEPRFNLTLLELLKQDFDLKIPGMDHELPSDDSGVNVERVLDIVRHAVRDVPGFEVVPDVVLGTFSFAKYLMWKDLVDRRDQLERNAVVKHLIDREGAAFEREPEFPQADRLDDTIDPGDLFLPLPADSSQLAAVVASAQGCNFVLDGPPGTGKSQTIANMIAHNLAGGRRVLFVAEKMAALDVVYRRLEEKGLGDFCLEVHSNKTSKVEVLKQLERAWDTRDLLSAEEWAREAAEVRRLRDRLNSLVRLLHTQQPNGLTLHQAIGRVVRDADSSTLRLAWPAGARHDEAEYARLCDVARRLDLNLAAIFAVPAGFGLVAKTEWSNGWQESLVAAASDTPQRIDALTGRMEALLTELGLPLETPGEVAAVEGLLAFANMLLRTFGVRLEFAFEPDFTDRIAAGRRAADLIEEYRRIEEDELSARYGSEACRSLDLTSLESRWAEAQEKFWLLGTLARHKVARMLATQGRAVGRPGPGQDLPLLRRMNEILQELDGLAPLLSGIPGWAELKSDPSALRRSADLAADLRSAISSRASSPETLTKLRAAVRRLVVDANELLGAGGRIASATEMLGAELEAFRAVADRFRELCSLAPDTAFDLEELRSSALAIQEHRLKLKAWCDWCRTRQEAISLGLSPLVEAIENGALPQGQVEDAFAVGYARWFAADVIDAEAELRSFVSAEHMSDIESYRRLTDRLSELSSRYVRSSLCNRIPDRNSVGKRDGYGILKHELQKQRRHKPLRQLAVEMGDALTTLAPCMLMSPLSIAQYLPPELELFDLVIFDEASQIAPWDAIGSIARGKQVVIAGDPRQMPPTSFFNRAAAVTDDDVEEDMESILDECLGAGVPRQSLEWHYRSRHESLIAFSNHRYYEGRLVTFPAPVTRASAVAWKRVPGVYAKGKTRTNQAEAEAMVAEAVTRLQDPEFIAAGMTLGIVTLNSEQQQLVENLLDKAREEHPEIERFFDEDLPEPVVVKNLETVQGDERDLVMLGVAYGPTAPGETTMSMNFGPLNREGGWRRLNVAVTRARKEMMVFTSFDPSMVDLNRTSARAVMDLKHYLEFAQRGPQALAEAVTGSVGGYESPFEEAVARSLMDRGWQVVPQIGVSRFRIDLGIVHPDRPGDYLVGVECDGATYHRAATARDRDKVRAGVLAGLGWKLLRVWSTEWWVDKAGAADRLDARIRELLEADRAGEEEGSFVREDPPELEIATPVAEFKSARARSAHYKVTDFSPLEQHIDPDQFYDDIYDEVLVTLIAHVLEAEGPIAEPLLAQRIARAHDFARTGRRINERVLNLARERFQSSTDAQGAVFYWHDSSSAEEWSTYRLPQSDDAVRKIEEISFEELRAAAAACRDGDAPREISRLFGINRLSSQARGRIEAALAEQSPLRSGPRRH